MREVLRAWDSGRGVAVGVLVLLGATPAIGQTAREVEDVFWGDVVCERELEVRAYLKMYPDGAYVSEAWTCLGRGLGLARLERVAVQRGLGGGGAGAGAGGQAVRGAGDEDATGDSGVAGGEGDGGDGVSESGAGGHTDRDGAGGGRAATGGGGTGRTGGGGDIPSRADVPGCLAVGGRGAEDGGGAGGGVSDGVCIGAGL